MSQRTLNQKKSLCSLKSGVLKSDRSTVTSKGDENSDDSDANMPFHRPRCPWGRRQSYVKKAKKSFLDDSLSYFNKIHQSSINRKPWLGAGVPAKDHETWKRPWGNKMSGVNCFCARIEQAKVAPPSRRNCPPDWTESRRNHIVHKFDGFSKGILKVTGKLSKITIDLITAKIKENLEKNSEINLEKLYSSSLKLVKTSPYSRLNESSRVLSSKIIPEASCVQVALMPSEFNMLGYNKRKPRDKSKPCINVYRKNVSKILANTPSQHKFRKPISRDKSVFGEALTSVSEVESGTEIDDLFYNKNNSSCKNVPSQEKGIPIRVKVKRTNENEFYDALSTMNTVPTCENEKDASTPMIHKVVNFCDRPVSMDKSNIFNLNKNSSAEMTTSSRPSSVSGKSTLFLERSASFDNIQYSDQIPLISDDNISYPSVTNHQITKKKPCEEPSNINQAERDVSISLVDHETIKSNLKYAKTQEATKRPVSEPSKKRYSRDWNIKKLIPPSSECTGSGYSVQLVRLRNYDRNDKESSLRKSKFLI